MSALGDVIVDALQKLLVILFSPIESLIETHAGTLIKLIVGTPYPNAVFARPTNGSWPAIYDYYWETMLPLALSLWGVSVMLVIFFHATGTLFSGYHRSKLTRRAISGLLGVLAWWWIAALSLRFVDALTGFIVPTLSDISLFETLSFTALGVLGVVLTLAIDLTLFGLLALVYLTRQLALYLYVLLMPLLIVFWIPGLGPFALVSGLMRRLAGFYVPFLFMTVPVAILFRLGGLLGTGADLSMGGIGTWLVALVIPVVALLSPLVLFWQAGTISRVAGQMARNMSAQTARNRAGTAATATNEGVQAGHNFARGIRDEAPVETDSQYALDSPSSRAHRAGARLNDAGTRAGTHLRDTFERSLPARDADGDPADSDRAGSRDVEPTGSGDEPTETQSQQGTADSRQSPEDGRETDFSALRGRDRNAESDSETSGDGSAPSEPGDSHGSLADAFSQRGDADQADDTASRSKGSDSNDESESDADHTDDSHADSND